MRRRNTTHGQKGTPEYRSWNAAKSRCFNPNHEHFADYGGRGITMCAEWRESFAVFRRDMGPRPTLKYTLDRFPNPNGHYEPGNCRWATSAEQQNNRINNRRLEIDGIAMTIAQAARLFGLSRNVIYARINRGWPMSMALLLPVWERRHIFAN